MREELSRLGKDSIVYGFGTVVTRFVSLVTLPLFTAYLSPQEYGVLAMLAMLNMVAHPVFSLGLSAAMGPSYFKSESADLRSQVVWAVFLITAVSATVLVVLAWVLDASLGRLIKVPSEYHFLVSVSLTGTALTILTTSFSHRLQFERKAGLYVVITITTGLVAILISIYTVVFYGMGARGMIYGQVAGNLTTLIAFLLVGVTQTAPSINLRIIKDLLKTGLPLVPSFAFLFVLMHANKYILEWYHGLGHVGVYSIAHNLGMALGIVVSAIQVAWYPFYMRYMSKQAEAEFIFGKIFSYYVLGVGVLTLMFFIFAKPVVLILTAPSYAEAYLAVGLVASAYFFTGIYSLLLPGLYFKNEVGVQSLIQGIAVAVCIPISFPLIENLGVLGAGLSVSIGHLLMALFTGLWNFYRRREYISVRYEWFRVGGFAGFFGVVSLIILVFRVDGLVENIFISVIFFVIILLTAIQFFSKEEISHFPYLQKLKF